MSPRASTVSLLVMALPWSAIWASSSDSQSSIARKSPFKIIVDGGSTGSRLHIFEFVEEELATPLEDDTSSTAESKINGTVSSIKVRCVRRGSSRADTPLSAFGRLASDSRDVDLTPLNPSDVAAHLLPAFEYAASIVPPAYHNSTGVFYQATAGMRLLDESEQEAVYDALYQGLMQAESFVFTSMQRKDIATLGGEMEAYYGAVAANFLQGIIDSELRLTSRQQLQEEGERDREIKAKVQEFPVGALDMGGSSTQIVYMSDYEQLMKQHEAPACDNPIQPQVQNNKGGNACLPSETPRLSDDHFFSTSYLSYGVDQFRERLWSTLVQERLNEEKENPECCIARIVSNPCANKGFEVEWDGFTLIGSGDTKECIRQTRRLIPHPEIPVDYHASEDTYNPSSAPSGVVGGVEHPPIRGKFLAMSLYFFSLDSLRVFSKPDEEAHSALNRSWPNPSIEELHNALDGLCSRDWHSDMALQEGMHTFTRAEVLPHRCLEAVYMVTLLKDGFGFHPSSRDITFTFLVDGSEVEWTLGMALAMNADEQQVQHYDREEGAGGQYLEMKTIDELFLFQGVPNPFLFGVTLPPTHCC